MANITLLGQDFLNVPSAAFPKTGGGTVVFSEGGGTTTLKYGTLRPDAELVKTYSYDKLIHADEEVTIPAYTTTSTSLKASAELSPTYTLDYANYNYFVLERALSIPQYSVTTKAKGRAEYSFASACYEIVEFPADTFQALLNTTKVTSRSASVYAAGNAVRLVYWSSGTALAAYSTAAYGAAQTITAPSLSSGVLTLKSPALIVRGHTTYFTNTYFNALTDIRYQWIIEVYRAPKSNLNLDGWGTFTQAGHIIECVDSASHTLT